MGVLGGHVHRELALAGVVVGERRARLDGVRDEAVVAHLDPGLVGGPFEGGRDRLGVTQLPVEGDVAFRLVVHERLVA